MRSRKSPVAKKEGTIRKHPLVSQIIASVPALIVVYNITSGEYVFVNDAIGRVLGYTKDAFLKGGITFAFSIVHPDDIPRIAEQNKQALEKANKQSKHTADEIIATFEYRMRHADGTWRWLHSDGTVFDRDKSGNVLHVMNVSVDITERKRLEDEAREKRTIAEAKVREGEERYKAFIQQSGEGIWRFELEQPLRTDWSIKKQINHCYKYAYLAECNDAMAKMYGYEKAEELVGARLTDMLIRTDPNNIAYLTAFIQSGYKRMNAESHELDKYGNLRYFQNNLIGIYENGRIIRAWGIQRDITEQKKAEQALNESKEQLQTILTGVADGITMQDAEGTLVFVNETIAKSSGYTSPEDMIRNPQDLYTRFEILDETGKPFPSSQYPGRRALAGEREPQATFRYVDKNNMKEYWSTVKARPIFDELGNVIYAINIFHDITEQKLHERALEQSERQYRRLIDHSPLPIIIHIKGTIAYINREGLKLLAAKQVREVIGKNILTLVPTDDHASVMKRVEGIYNGKSEYNDIFEGRVIRLDGEIIEVEVASLLFRFQGQQAIQVIARDITARKKAEEALRQTEERLRVVTDNAASALFMLNKDGVATFMNPAAEKIIGFTFAEIQKKALHFFIHHHRPNGKPYRLQDCPVGSAFAKGIIVTGEEVFVRKGGEFFPAAFSISPILHNGSVEGAVLEFQDITGRKKLERQKDEFIGIASHELKTPVTSIKAYAQVLRNRFAKMGDIQSAELLMKMDTQLNKLTILISDLLDVTKIETGKLLFHKDWFDINELIKEVVEEMQHISVNHRIIVKLDASRTIFADRYRIGQVMTNFLSNAIKYSPQGTEIFLRSTVDKKHISVSVQDFGRGVAQVDQEKIFERFYRGGGKVLETYPGLGLGLFICREIIRRHNGKIWVESKKRKGQSMQGSTFFFCLPTEEGERCE